MQSRIYAEHTQKRTQAWVSRRLSRRTVPLRRAYWHREWRGRREMKHDYSERWLTDRCRGCWREVTVSLTVTRIYIGWVKKVSCWFSANMSIKLRRWEEREQTRTSTEKMEHCLIFSHETFYVTIVLCLNILWLKAVNEITARQTRTSLRKHDVIKVCSIEYLTTQMESVLPTFKSWTVHEIMEYLTKGLLSGV